MSVETREFDALFANIEPRVEIMGGYIAYFHVDTNTYGDLNHIREIYREFQKRNEGFYPVSFVGF